MPLTCVWCVAHSCRLLEVRSATAHIRGLWPSQAGGAQSDRGGLVRARRGMRAGARWSSAPVTAQRPSVAVTPEWIPGYCARTSTDNRASCEGGLAKAGSWRVDLEPTSNWSRAAAECTVRESARRPRRRVAAACAHGVRASVARMAPLLSGRGCALSQTSRAPRSRAPRSRRPSITPPLARTSSDFAPGTPGQARCWACSRCAAVSLSLKWRDCSWYTRCATSRLHVDVRTFWTRRVRPDAARARPPHARLPSDRQWTNASYDLTAAYVADDGKAERPLPSSSPYRTLLLPGDAEGACAARGAGAIGRSLRPAAEDTATARDPAGRYARPPALAPGRPLGDALAAAQRAGNGTPPWPAGGWQAAGARRRQVGRLRSRGRTPQRRALMCTSAPGALLVVGVVSAPDHTRQRQAARSSWMAHLAPVEMLACFSIGLPPSMLRVAPDGTQGRQGIPQGAAELRRESGAHGDLVLVGDANSSGLMTEGSYGWWAHAVARFPDARFVAKTDDDAVVNGPALASHLHRLSCACRTRTRTSGRSLPLNALSSTRTQTLLSPVKQKL